MIIIINNKVLIHLCINKKPYEKGIECLYLYFPGVEIEVKKTLSCAANKSDPDNLVPENSFLTFLLFVNPRLL